MAEWRLHGASLDVDESISLEASISWGRIRSLHRCINPVGSLAEIHSKAFVFEERYPNTTRVVYVDEMANMFRVCMSLNV